MSIATRCVQDLVEKLQSLNEFRNSIFDVYSEEDFLDKISRKTFPCAGVFFEGIQAVANADPSRQGIMADVRLSVIVALSGKAFGNIDRKESALDILDDLRDAVLTKCSPSNHRWVFLSEQPLGEEAGILLYQQRWYTRAPLTK